MICRLFNFDMLRDRGEERYNTITTTTTGSWWHGGVWKARFQQSSSTHSGAGEKETQNMNVVGKSQEKNKKKIKHLSNNEAFEGVEHMMTAQFFILRDFHVL